MKYLIVGLGNIGREYEGTRHNIGFEVVDQLAKDLDSSFSIDRHAMVAQAKFKSRILVLVKPTTFMNLSGKALKYWLTQENIPIENTLVILDDLALPLGKLRLKIKGGDGNHNGLTSIIEQLGHSDFSRLRFGIGSDFKRGFQSDYVLGNWKPEELKILPERIDLAVDIIKSFCTIGVERTMTAFNNQA
jgi:PTH1 family peptidyl-tRNA hydrolase